VIDRPVRRLADPIESPLALRRNHPMKHDAMSEPPSPSLRTDDAHLLRQLAAYPDVLRQRLSGISNEILRRPARDGGWSVLENLCHERDWEEVFLGRLRAILTEDRPELPAFDDSLWEIERNYCAQEPSRALDRFAELRREFVALLQAAPPEAWDRVGIHGQHGPIDVRWLARHQREHDKEHEDQIRDTLG
jgi:DinB superfamily